jgi:ankyrin repeat protein
MAFLKAAAAGDIGTLGALFSAAAATLSDDEGKGALHHAAAAGQAAAVDWLLVKGFAVDTPTKKGASGECAPGERGGGGVARAQRCAARCNSACATPLTPPPPPPPGLTPLHYAIFKGHVPVARALHAAGASFRARDATGRAPLHLAAAAGCIAALEWLVLELGADARDVSGAEGMEAAHFAALSGHLEALEWLGARAGGGSAHQDARAYSASLPCVFSGS